MGAWRTFAGTRGTSLVAPLKKSPRSLSLRGDQGRAYIWRTSGGSMPAVKNRANGIAALIHHGAFLAASSSAATALTVSSTYNCASCSSQYTAKSARDLGQSSAGMPSAVPSTA